MPKEIADAFGLHLDSLERLEHEEDATSAGNCWACEEWERKYVELASELAECRNDVERYQCQIEQLLRTKSVPRGVRVF